MRPSIALGHSLHRRPPAWTSSEERGHTASLTLCSSGTWLPLVALTGRRRTPGSPSQTARG